MYHSKCIDVPLDPYGEDPLLSEGEQGEQSEDDSDKVEKGVEEQPVINVCKCGNCPAIPLEKGGKCCHIFPSVTALLEKEG